LSKAPDYLGPITGWRGWYVVADEHVARLSSFVYPTLWPPRRELRATCRHRPLRLLRPWRRRPPDHDAPNESCKCGIYATADPEKAAAYLEGCIVHAEPIRWPVLHRVIGRVSLWGSVVECVDGWRASHAYPERLYVPSLHDAFDDGSDSRTIACELTAYGVPIERLECWAYEDVAAVLRVKVAAQHPNDTSAAA
jgi:hypothetical protein